MPKVTRRVKLTKREVDGAKSNGHETFLWDSEVSGFGLRVRPSGRKTFVLQYFAGQRTRRVNIGDFGTFTAEQARERARALKQSVHDGGNPAEERRRMRHADTVEQLADRYREHHAALHKKPSSVRADETILKGRILPALGKLKVADVARADVQKLHHGMQDVPYHANRTLSLLSKMMNLAERWGLRPDGSNPTRHVERYREQKRQRFLSAVELARLGAVLAEIERERVEWHSVVPALRLLIFTGARVSEILTAKWVWVDFERACLNLPDSKTGAKVIHLNPPALQVLANLERDDANPYIIRGRVTGECLVNLKDPWGRIRQRAELPGLRVHDLRHSFAAVAAGAGSSLPVIGALLGHSQPATTNRYVHLAADPLKEANDRVGARLVAMMNATRDKAGSNVVELSRAQRS